VIIIDVMTFLRGSFLEIVVRTDLVEIGIASPIVVRIATRRKLSRRTTSELASCGLVRTTSVEYVSLYFI
jgi:hypothetical protein